MVVETGVEEFEREEKVGTNANTKRTARDEEVIEDEDETQLPEDRKSTRLNSSHLRASRMPSSA